MMNEFRIYDVLGYVLQDDILGFGGVAFDGETVEDFIETTLLSKTNSVKDLNEKLVACGILPIEITPEQFLNNAKRYIRNYGDLSEKEIYELPWQQKHRTKSEVEKIVSDIELFLDVYDVFDEEAEYFCINRNKVVELIL